MSFTNQHPAVMSMSYLFKSLLPRTFFLFLFLAAAVVFSSCSATENDTDVCEGFTNRFADGGVSRSECEASSRGEFIEGGCYCHAEQ